MTQPSHTPPDPRRQKEEPQTLPDSTPRREGGDDSFAESSPNDSRSDEKVIVNEQLSNKAVNAPSQTGVNTDEEGTYED